MNTPDIITRAREFLDALHETPCTAENEKNKAALFVIVGELVEECERLRTIVLMHKAAEEIWPVTHKLAGKECPQPPQS